MVKFEKWKIPVLIALLFFLLGIICYEKNLIINAESIGIVSVTGTLNVREGAGASYKIVGTLTNGVKVTILQDLGNGWLNIQSGTLSGYVASQYIKINAVDSAYRQQLIDSGFPESYSDALTALHTQYPNWQFVPCQTGLDWNIVVDNETAIGRNNVASTSTSTWKSVEQGAYNVDNGTWVAMDGTSWVVASRAITEYYLDPRNFLDSSNIFLFSNHTYDASKQNEATLSTMVSGTFLANSYNENNTTIKYSTALMNAASSSNVNPYVLASMILVEQGNSGAGDSISGSVTGFEGFYNHFNVGAYATTTMTAVQRGLWFAKGSGINAVSYLRPWNGITSSVQGGAQFYGSNYVQIGQNTLYLKKFNVQGLNLYNHQYMTNVQGAASEAKKLALAYKSIIDGTLTFTIPVYSNMPASPTSKPTGDGNSNNYLKSLSIAGTTLNPVFNLYTNEYSMIVNSSNPSITILAESYVSSSIVSGAGTVNLQEGMNTIELVVTAQNGTRRTYTLTISKTGGSTGGSGGGSSDSGSSDSGNHGTLGAYTITDGYVTGVNTSMDVEKLIANMNVTDAIVSVYKSESVLSSGTVGTGCIIRITDSSGKVLEQYTILIHGDVNGDGKITIADMLKTQKIILNLEQSDASYSAAADVNKDGKISIIDLLKIQKTLLGLETISQ